MRFIAAIVQTLLVKKTPSGFPKKLQQPYAYTSLLQSCSVPPSSRHLLFKYQRLWKRQDFHQECCRNRAGPEMKWTSLSLRKFPFLLTRDAVIPLLLPHLHCQSVDNCSRQASLLTPSNLVPLCPISFLPYLPPIQWHLWQSRGALQA